MMTFYVLLGFKNGLANCVDFLSFCEWQITQELLKKAFCASIIIQFYLNRVGSKNISVK